MVFIILQGILKIQINSSLDISKVQLWNMEFRYNMDTTDFFFS